jgi:hypothetical protein
MNQKTRLSLARGLVTVAALSPANAPFLRDRDHVAYSGCARAPSVQAATQATASTARRSFFIA